MRNPLHAICPYFAMFPEGFVQRQLLAYTQPGDVVFDPFCGRGTTILESLLNGRQAIGTDINPVAACVSGAKADVPELSIILQRINDLENRFVVASTPTEALYEFFYHCFSTRTLAQVLFLRRELNWQSDTVDRFIAAMALGVLHGESHKTELCLSNRMPRTISTKPEYSVRWWSARNLIPPDRDTFAVLRACAQFRLVGQRPTLKGEVHLADARSSGAVLASHQGKASLVVTSPPYLDTTDYAEDQWLRLWFLGGPDRPAPRLHKDDRYTNSDQYWEFLKEVWYGSENLLADNAIIVIRIGGTMLDKDKLFSGVSRSLADGLANRNVVALHDGETSTIKRRQTNSFRPGTSPEKVEHDFAYKVTKTAA